MSRVDEIEELMKGKAEGKKAIGKIVKFDLGEEHGYVTIDGKSGDTNQVSQNEADWDATIVADPDTLIDLVTGKKNPQGLMMTGKVKLKGNPMVVMKLGELIS